MSVSKRGRRDVRGGSAETRLAPEDREKVGTREAGRGRGCAGGLSGGRGCVCRHMRGCSGGPRRRRQGGPVRGRAGRRHRWRRVDLTVARGHLLRARDYGERVGVAARARRQRSGRIEDARSRGNGFGSVHRALPQAAPVVALRVTRARKERKNIVRGAIGQCREEAKGAFSAGCSARRAKGPT